MLVAETVKKARIDSGGIVEMDEKMHKAQNVARERPVLIDNGGRRFGGDRRVFDYNGYLPERRSGKERRSGNDRRKSIRLP